VTKEKKNNWSGKGAPHVLLCTFNRTARSLFSYRGTAAASEGLTVVRAYVPLLLPALCRRRREILHGHALWRYCCRTLLVLRSLFVRTVIRVVTVLEKRYYYTYSVQ
jgi:hypothetical protein